MQPGTDNLWCVVNERDHLGPDLVPDYMARVQEGGFYGWPWYYIGDNEDPALKGKRPDLKGHVRVPEVLIQAHLRAERGVLRSRRLPGRIPRRRVRRAARLTAGPKRTGYKVIRVRMKERHGPGWSGRRPASSSTSRRLAC